MNAVPRQGYFLGKIVKGVKKFVGGVADAAGKVLKSDIGKMALLAAGAYYMPGYGIKATGGFSNMMGANGFFKTAGGGLKTLAEKSLLKDGMNFGDKGSLSLGKILGLSAVLPFIPYHQGSSTHLRLYLFCHHWQHRCHSSHKVN